MMKLFINNEELKVYKRKYKYRRLTMKSEEETMNNNEVKKMIHIRINWIEQQLLQLQEENRQLAEQNEQLKEENGILEWVRENIKEGQIDLLVYNKTLTQKLKKAKEFIKSLITKQDPISSNWRLTQISDEAQQMLKELEQ